MRTQLTDTPPPSPNLISPDMVEEMDDIDDDLFDDDLEEVNVEAAADSESDDDNAGIQPSRDDAKLVFSKHYTSVLCCQLEPMAGLLAVTGGVDDAGYVWSTQTGETVLKCTGHNDSVVGVGFNYDGTYVATGDMGGTIKVWKIASKSLIWEGNVDNLEWLQWHHGANVLLCGTLSGNIYMWRIPGGDMKVFSSTGKKTHCGVILPDGKRAAAGYEDGTLKVFDMKSGTVLQNFSEGQAHQDDLLSIDCHPDNNLLITGDVDGRAVISTTQNGKVVSVLDCSGSTQDNDMLKGSVEAVGFYGDPSLPLAATATLGGLLSVWDVSKGMERHKLQVETGMTRLVWDKSNPLIYAGKLDGSVVVYDARSGSIERQFLGHSDGIMDLSLSRASNILLTTSDDSTARVFSI